MVLTLNVVAGNELQHLINEDDGEGKLQDDHPLFNVQMGQLEDHLGGKRVEVRTADIESNYDRNYTSQRTVFHFNINQ